MDAVFQRIRSYELALIEVMAHIDREHILAGLISIGEGLFDDVSDEERKIRLGAIVLLRTALEYFDRPGDGMQWQE
jgi:hypothetical protein